jgi:predicted component of type VI protein secretion system
MRLSRSAVLTIVILPYITGCSSEATLVKASGVVLKSDGKPLAEVDVRFYPLENVKKLKSIPFGLTSRNGEFQIGFDPAKPGIPPGEYKATITVIIPSEKKSVAAKYSDHQQTPWLVTIPRTGKTDIVLKVE